MSVMEKELHTIMNKPKGSSTDELKDAVYSILNETIKGYNLTKEVMDRNSFVVRKTDKMHSLLQAYLKAKLSELLEKLPNKKSDISGYHEDHTPEQLTRITAMNRQHNQTLSEVREAIEKMLEDLR